MNLNSLLKQIQDVSHKRSDTVPPGWKTLKELSKEWGKARNTAEHTLKRGIAAKVIEVKVFRIFDGRTLRKTKHYRQVGK
jgi:hypothetical protein